MASTSEEMLHSCKRESNLESPILSFNNDESVALSSDDVASKCLSVRSCVNPIFVITPIDSLDGDEDHLFTAIQQTRYMPARANSNPEEKLGRDDERPIIIKALSTMPAKGKLCRQSNTDVDDLNKASSVSFLTETNKSSELPCNEEYTVSTMSGKKWQSKRKKWQDEE
ncbi:hypothetical protein Ciccas_010753 [Cichlidogyrus casuarinus]|uniref:Uncharacterized protein n=1 Tax=Cichlidogyrus casuarinus TaxID=1844966 RepID=A0ABD2PW44_9PLAT